MIIGCVANVGGNQTMYIGRHLQRAMELVELVVRNYSLVVMANLGGCQSYLTSSTEVEVGAGVAS